MYFLLFLYYQGLSKSNPYFQQDNENWEDFDDIEVEKPKDFENQQLNKSLPKPYRGDSMSYEFLPK